METLNCAGQILDLSTPKVMGILNVTPDSFHDGGRYLSEQLVIKRVEDMLNSGADLIDIGGYSSRPGAEHISQSEEKKRVMPFIRAIVWEFPKLLLSIDTFRSEIAREAVEAGACMVNDISGGNLDAKMFGTVAKLKVPYVLMHMRGTPQNMQENTHYDNLISEVVNYFRIKITQLRELGVNDVIIDPGFGFGKSVDGNYKLLHRLGALSILECPILAGISRKGMVQKVFGKDDANALKGTMALNLISLLEGASVLRVHDIKEAKDMVALYSRLLPQ
ncbi:MAG: dihydropteroate synthase [Flavobacteriales bacterium]|nr:dihydropteroate synthase [Flavobacteriales bacterium]